ncbi:hypothetical protein GCM10010172_15950 [Paractinoplanes ferrugineus]|uniref:Uncharacterized protein n=1 Tax=Paractinoplanes ferrugineus TaxID=113564 RepID=A0A919MD35_9ACTN|nr:hypothetical protein Afe05nite_19990 [Actinoplanes ferrugineus]
MAIAIRARPTATVRAAPNRASTRGATIAVTAMIRAIGMNAEPASVGEKPSTFCR